LSFGQERLWFIEQLSPGNCGYSIPATFQLRGPLDVAALEKAFIELLRRHEALRTTFGTTDGEPVQVIHDLVDLRLIVVNVSSVDEARRLAEEDARTPFDLSQGPLFRVRLLRLSAEDHILHITVHHAVSDGWSMRVLFREIEALYAAFCDGKPSLLPELPVQYADFAQWQRSSLQGEVIAKQLSYWRKQLEGAPELLELPTDRPRPPVGTHCGSTLRFRLPKGLSEQVKGLSRREGVTPFMVFLTAFNVLLGRYSGQVKIVVGTPTANRTHVEVEPLIGFFVNTLALATDLSGDPTFKELVKRVRETSLNAYAHQDLPFEKLVDELKPERNLSHSPIFQVMFALQNQQTWSARALGLQGIDVERFSIATSTALFDLTLSIFEREDGFALFEYNTDLFDRSTVERMMGHFTTLLEAAAVSPGTRVAHLPLLTETERRQLVVDWNDTSRDYPRQSTIHELVAQQAARTADAVATVWEEESLTYGELDGRANRLARLLRAHGVNQGDLVGICVRRSMHMPVGLLGILKAGAAYLPLDPDYPRERLAYMLADAAPQVLLTELDLVSGLSGPVATLCLDSPPVLAGLERTSDDAPRVSVSPDDRAYVIYTSGSTGAPKGVQISHRAICNRLHWGGEALPLGADDHHLQNTTFSFDTSVTEFFAPLSAGAQVVMVRPGGNQDPAYLTNLIADRRVTSLELVPTMLEAFLDTAAHAKSITLKRVFAGAEALSSSLAHRFFERFPNTELYNLYGPTEATVECTHWLCDRGPRAGAPPIGRPIANAQIHLRDPHGELVPVGVPGELYVGGHGLARGYLKRPQSTAERFVPDPLSLPGSRLYRTGDQARRSLDGLVEYLGRLDHQVKIRGFRIELGEIEAALCAQTSVREAVVVVREDIPGNKQLVAYIVSGREALAIEGIRAALKRTLPEYMIPSAFVVLGALPLSPNGKVDRRALPKPELRPDAGGEIDQPKNPIEKTLAAIWSDVLKIERVGRNDSFFDLGGHSLLALQVVARLRKSLGIETPLQTIFEEQRLAGLAFQIARLIIAQKPDEILSRIDEFAGEDLDLLMAELESHTPGSQQHG
jgi:amino acid adenylation domain-containing protein